MYAHRARLDKKLNINGGIIIMGEKYLIDASIIASSLEDFKRRFVETDCTLVLSDLTFRELEPRKKDKKCEFNSVSFVRFLIDLFVKDTFSTEICFIEDEDCKSKHIDEDLVLYAKSQNMSILTCDKGMALWCRFYNVKCELLNIRSVTTLPFIHESNGSLHLNLKQVPIGCSTFVYSPEKNKIMSSLGSDIMFLIPGNILLVAQAEQQMCCIETYFVNKDLSISLVGKNLYSSEEDIDTDTNPFHINLYDKWNKHIAKHNV